MSIAGNIQMIGGTQQGAGRNHTYNIPQKTVAIRPSSICLRGGTHSTLLRIDLWTHNGIIESLLNPAKV